MAPQIHFLPEDCVRMDGERMMVDPRCINATVITTEAGLVQLDSPLGLSLVASGVLLACGTAVTGRHLLINLIYALFLF